MMGKASKKVSKKQQLNKELVQSKKIEEAKRKIEAFKEEGQYEDGLLAIIELLQGGLYNADILYLAAELYFMAADYERAVIWINKTLDVSSEYLAAKLLLARICMLEDREEDALAIIKVLRKSEYGGQLTLEQQLQVAEIADYFKLDDTATDHLVSPIDAGESSLEKGSIGSGLLENKTQRENGEEINLKAEENAAAVAPMKDSETLVEEIFAKDLPTIKKIELCNSFAGAFFYEERNSEAKKMLDAALSLDGYDEMTIRNMISLLLTEDRKDQALEYASKLIKTDFELIKVLKSL